MKFELLAWAYGMSGAFVVEFASRAIGAAPPFSIGACAAFATGYYQARRYFERRQKRQRLIGRES